MRLLDHIKADWELVKNESERGIIETSAEEGRYYVARWVWFTYISTVFFLIMSSSNILLDLVAPLNETRPRAQPYSAEYFIDEEKYFYFIYAHEFISLTLGLTCMLATDTLVFTYMYHAYGLFRLAGYRLTHGFDKNANNSPIAESYICQQKISDGIELHKRAIRWSYFFTLSLSLVCISVSLFCLTLVADRSRREFGLFLITSGAVIAYIFVYMYPGQGLIDCSNAVIQKTYSALWYSKPVKVQKLILLVMQRSMIPSVLLIGNVAPVSLESFTWIFQTSISYFTALCSLK